MIVNTEIIANQTQVKINEAVTFKFLIFATTDPCPAAIQEIVNDSSNIEPLGIFWFIK